MGSFDVNCGISGLPIHERDTTGFLILKKKASYYDRGFSSAPKNLIVNADDLYSPSFPPIYGVYNDYGRITDIRKSATTKLLEKFYRRPVQVIFNCIQSDSDIYAYDGPIAANYANTELPSFLNRDEPLSGHLSNLGFVETKLEDGTLAYTFSGFEMFKNEDENKWIIRDIASKYVYGQMSTAKNITEMMNIFGEKTRKYPGFDEVDFATIRSLHSYTGMFFLEEVFQGMNKYLHAEHYMNNYENKYRLRFEKQWVEAMAATIEAEKDGKDTFSILYDYQPVESFLQKVSFPPGGMSVLVDYVDAPEEIFALANMIKIAEGVCRPFGPSVYVSLGEGDRPAKMLNMVAANVLSKRQKLWEEENLDPDGEDEDEENYWDFPEVETDK